MSQGSGGTGREKTGTGMLLSSFIKAISGSSMRSHPQSRCASRVPILGTGRGTGSRGEVLGHSRQDKLLGAEKMA